MVFLEQSQKKMNSLLHAVTQRIIKASVFLYDYSFYETEEFSY